MSGLEILFIVEKTLQINYIEYRIPVLPQNLVQDVLIRAKFVFPALSNWNLEFLGIFGQNLNFPPIETR